MPRIIINLSNRPVFAQQKATPTLPESISIQTGFLKSFYCSLSSFLLLVPVEHFHRVGKFLHLNVDPTLDISRLHGVAGEALRETTHTSKKHARMRRILNFSDAVSRFSQFFMFLFFISLICFNRFNILCAKECRYEHILFAGVPRSLPLPCLFFLGGRHFHSFILPCFVVNILFIIVYISQ